ncbi:MAG: folylpolyglutamate synthase/dihydrofolate synthase family protein [Candidatus Diapherotrites archaeon]|nr:folylpolyglutamate synthase/dihydrofolate synthase family protein [Candidatus Diapherotrites archaeon]
MNYAQGQNYLTNLEKYGIQLGLTRIKKALSYLNQPEQKTKFIHIAGTNGKGSTAYLLAGILKNAGYRTGLYISPEIVCFEERIQINGKYISKKEVTKQTEKIKKLNKKFNLKLTQFEFITVLALNYFTQQKCDIVVLETGLGGRMDATNIVQPEASVIMNIGLEHTEILGNTLEKIAKEKAGIIKENSILVTGEKNRKILKLFEKICEKKNTQIYRLGKEFKVNQFNQTWNFQTIHFSNKTTKFKKMKLKMLGLHQCENAGLAIETAIKLKEKGWNQINEKAIRKSLGTIQNPGRLQTIQKKPRIILDCAHNEHGINALVQSMEKLLKRKKIRVIFGVLKDKNVNNMISKIIPLAEKIYCTEPENKRALPAQELKKIIQKRNKQIPIEVIQNPKKAIQKALQESSSKDVILICGSCYLISQLI